jgi:hypothetical protein
MKLELKLEEIYGMMWNKMDQPGNGRYQEQMKEPAKIKMKRL